MRFGSVCSGIEAASVAFGPLGWKAAWLAEIEAFPSAVLAHHYPDVPNLGDMTAIRARIDAGEIEAPDLLCGGTPCQSFSVAGLRRSLDDARGNLALEFIRIADAIDRVRCAARKRPAYVLWENVPGVLNTKDNAFGSFLGGLCGGDTALNAPADGWPSAGVVAGPSRVVAWRVLDAQFFGVPQRRRRVFVLALGGAGGWSCADALLPITDSLSGHPAPSRQAREGVAPTLSARTKGGGGLGTDFDCDGGLITGPSIGMCLNAHGGGALRRGIGDADSYHRGRLRCRSRADRRRLRRERGWDGTGNARRRPCGQPCERGRHACGGFQLAGRRNADESRIRRKRRDEFAFGRADAGGSRHAGPPPHAPRVRAPARLPGCVP